MADDFDPDAFLAGDLPDAPRAARASAPHDDFDPDAFLADTHERPKPEGPIMSGLREAAHGVIPAAAGLITGGAAGALAAPSGPGALVAGAAGFIGGSMAAEKLQHAIYDGDDEQRAVNAEANPNASFIGGLAPALATMSPMGVGETLGKQAVQRSVGAAAMGGFEAGGEYLQGEDLNPTHIMLAAGAGAAFPGVNKVGSALHGIGEDAVAAVKSVPGRPGRTANPAADQAHADVGDSDAEINLDKSSLWAQPDDPQPTTGNPQSAPERSETQYGKDKTPATAQNDMLTQGDVAPDTAAALATEAPAPEMQGPINPDGPIPGFDDHPSGVGQPPPQPRPVLSEEGLLEASRLQRQALENSRTKASAQQLDQEAPENPTLDPDRPAAKAVPDAAAAAIATSKSKRPTLKMPEASVEAGFPEAGAPVAAGENDVPPPIKGKAADPIGKQAEAGNYLKARSKDFGKPIAIETNAGGIRRSKPGHEPAWENVSPYHYGDFKETIGADKDPVDYARPDESDTAHIGDKHFVIDQKDAATGKFDEHKVFGYYKDEAAARDHFAKGFSDGVDRLGGIKEVSRADLVKLLAKATKKAWTKPFSMGEGIAGTLAAVERPTTSAKPAAERAVVKDLLTKLEANGKKDVADKIRAMPEDQILAAAAGKRTRNYGTGTGASAGYPVEGLTTSEGKPVTANTKTKAAARSKDHANVEKWFEDSKPPSQMDPSKETDAELMERIKGAPETGYVPSHKPASWMLRRLAKDLQTKATPGKIAKFRDAERLLRGSKEDVDNYRGGNRVEADIARSKRSGDDAVANAEAKNVDNGRNSVEDDMIDAIDAKRTPLNTRADLEASKPTERGVDVHDSSLAKVDTKKIDREVSAAAKKRAEEAKALAGKKGEANVASEEKKASAPRKIDIGKEDHAAILERLKAATTKAASRDPKLDITAPVEKTSKGLRGIDGVLHDFAHDEGGSLDIQKIKADFKAAFKTTEPKTYIAKKSNGMHDDYIRSLGEDLHKINQEDKNHAVGIKQAVAAMPKELDAAMRERLYHARDADSAHVDLPGKQAGKTNIESLPQRDQDLYNQHLKPVLDQNDMFVANIRAIDPDRMGPDVTDHISRIVKGETDKYNILSGNDPTQPQHSGIGVNADAAKARKYYALENAATGERHVIQPTDNGFIKWKGYKRETIKDPTFDFEDGKAYTAGKNQFNMRQATTKEIEANARGLDGKKKPMQYYKDAGLAATASNLQLGSMARHLAELQRIRTTPEFEKLSTTNRKTAEDRGWKETNLPNFKGTFLHPDLKAVLDDYAGHPSNSLRDLNNWVTKALFWMPIAHINNVGTHWFVGRGFDNITPAGIKSLLVDTPRAIKSVVNQDAFQREMRTNGAGTVYGGVLSRDMVGQLGKAFQQDVRKNPAEWNIMAKTLGVDLGDMANAIYNASSKVMWSANDVFLTQRVMELQRKGMDIKTAIYEAEKDIPNYRIPIKVIGSGEKGRMLAQALGDPAKTSFGRYHYGMMNSYANIVKGALSPQSTMGDRLQAVGKMMALGLLVTGVYPVLDKLAKTISGNDDASAQRRGPVSIPYHLYKALTGTEDAASALRGTLTLPPLTTTMLETLSNKDFRGKAIVEPGTMQRAGKGSLQAAGEALVQEGEHAARGLVSPLNTLETAVAKRRPGEGAMRGPVRAVVDQAADIKDPSQRATQWERKAPIKNLRDERIRDRQGGSGFIEGLYNKATKQ